MLSVMQGASSTGGTPKGTSAVQRRGRGRQIHTQKIGGCELSSNNTERTVPASAVCKCVDAYATCYSETPGLLKTHRCGAWRNVSPLRSADTKANANTLCLRRLAFLRQAVCSLISQTGCLLHDHGFPFWFADNHNRGETKF